MRNWNDEIMKKKKKESRENAMQLFSFCIEISKEWTTFRG